jgi:hypothetical protein
VASCLETSYNNSACISLASHACYMSCAYSLTLQLSSKNSHYSKLFTICLLSLYFQLSWIILYIFQTHSFLPVLILAQLIALKLSGEARHNSMLPLPCYVLLRTLSCASVASLPLSFGVEKWPERLKSVIIHTQFAPS